MNTIHRIHHLISILAAGACALLAFAAAAPAALAMPVSSAPPGLLQHPPVLPPEPGMTEAPAVLHAPVTGSVTVPVRTVAISGMPGWQIALITVAAALFAATVAVLADRAWAARRKAITAAA